MKQLGPLSLPEQNKQDRLNHIVFHKFQRMHKMSAILSCVNSPLALFHCLGHKSPNVEFTPSVYISVAEHK